MKKPPNAGKPHTPQSDKQLRAFVKGNTPTPLIAFKLGRSEDAIRGRAQNLNISLHPTNKSPYGTPHKKSK